MMAGLQLRPAAAGWGVRGSLAVVRVAGRPRVGLGAKAVAACCARRAMKLRS